MEIKKLTYSQKELMRARKERLQEAEAIFQLRQNELGETCNQIAIEHGIKEENFLDWEITNDNEGIVKKEKKGD